MISIIENSIPFLTGNLVSMVYTENALIPENTEFNNFLLLNSSFFNQVQWKKFVKELFVNIQSSLPLRFITYDFGGFVQSNYIFHKITINDFLKEIDAILDYYKIDKINLFGISIGAWIGLNYILYNKNKVQSYCGYGNLAPFIAEYNEMRKERFNHIRNSSIFIQDTKDLIINEKNWDFYFDHFYSPTFFNSLREQSINPKIIDLFKKILFPMVKGNNMKIIPDYYHYIIDTMITEGNIIKEKLGDIPKEIPCLFMNGIEDNIAYPIMTQTLHSMILHSKMVLFESLNHGSVLIGKGIKPILSTYAQFLKENQIS